MLNHIVTDVGEMPIFPPGLDIVLDLETTSGDVKLDSINPWHHCKIAGIAVKVKGGADAWYIPVAHAVGHNLPRHAVIAWARDVIRNCNRWINHNIKYDMHVMKNDFGIDPPEQIRCTMDSAKIIDCDRLFHGGYGLDALSKAWLHKGDDDGKQKATLAPYLVKNKDFGRIPIDVCGLYACFDVNLTDELDEYTETRIPERCQEVHANDQRLTLALWDIEQRGMRVDMNELKATELIAMTKMLQIEEKIHELTGLCIRPHTNDDCYEVLCGRYGLPVLAWTDDSEKDEEKRKPSFDKHALANYLLYPGAPKEVVAMMLDYRKTHTLNSLFVTKYQELQVDSVMHPTYNQAVRTFRMACSKPNAQQLSPEARALIHPGEGRCFISMDFSQIEYRLIVHYVKNPAAIAAYEKDVNTDFHQWVADMCGISRKPAKTINFLMGYGGGKEKLLTALSNNMALVGSLGKIVDGLIAEGKATEEQRPAIFQMLARHRSEQVHDKYHASLPELKTTSRDIARVMEQRGYIFNAHGRHLHGPPQLSHRAFNKVVQSEAAEVIKDRTVALAPRYCDEVRARDGHIEASVHDETLFNFPKEVLKDWKFLRWLRDTMCATRVEHRVKMAVSTGVSELNWRESAKNDDCVIDVDHECFKKDVAA